MKINKFKIILKQRKFLKKLNSNFILKQLNWNYFIVFHFNTLSGLGFKLLKYLLNNSNNFNLKFKIYYNYFTNYNIKNHLLIAVETDFELLKLINKLNEFIIIPYILYPLYILNSNKNILFEFKYINININKNLNFSKKNIIDMVLIKLLKKNILLFFFNLNQLKKNANLNSIS